MSGEHTFKVFWGEKHNPTKYSGGVYQTDKLGLNSNAGRIEGNFISTEELILNKGETFTNNNGETINCEFTLTKNEIKDSKTISIITIGLRYLGLSNKI